MNVHSLTMAKAEDKRTAILQATLALITENGFHATPIAMVAKEANVGAGTIYRYFESKEVLINELYAELKEHMGQAMMQQHNPAGTIKDKFYRYWLNLYHYFISNPQEFQFLEQYATSPYITQVTKEENQRHYLPVIEFLQEGMQQQVLRPMPIELMTALVYNAVTATVKLHLSAELSITDEVLQLALQSSWDGVKAI